MNKILITGAGGGLGTVLKLHLQPHYQVIAMNAQAMDVSDGEAVDRCMAMEQPDIVIHCAAYSNVDKAECDKESAYRVNVRGTENVAKACKKYGAELMFFSTDYIFDGEKEQPYEVEDPVAPLNYYGTTKILAEQIVRDLVERHYIVRISWLFGPYGVSFLSKMLALSDRESIQVVNDQIGSPTYTPHLAKALEALACTGKYGTYQITNEGSCTWAEYAQLIFSFTGSKTKVVPVDSNTYKTVAKRPHNSRLSKEKFYSLGLEPLPQWNEALEEFFRSQCALADQLN